VLGVLFVVVCGLLMFNVPPMMDEMMPYHVLSCLSHPGAHYNSFSQPCDGSLDLTILKMKLPLRAFAYVGAFSSLLYAPAFELVRNFHSARFLGVVSIVVCGVGIWRLTRASPLTVLAVVGLSFPFVFQMMTNTGHVGFQCSLVVWIPILLRKLMCAERRIQALGLSLLVGGLLFLGIEQKPLFLLFIPTVVLVGFLLSVPEDRGLASHLGPFVRRLLPAGILTASLTLLLFSASTTRFVDGARPIKGSEESYWHALASPQSGVLTPGPLSTFLLDLSRFSHRLFDVNSSSLTDTPHFVTDLVDTAVFWSIVLVALLGCLLVEARSGTSGQSWIKRPVVIFAGAAVIIWCSLVGFESHGVWGGHHVVFVFPYLLAALCVSLETLAARRRTLLLFTLVLTQLFLFAGLFQKKPVWFADWERVEILDYIESTGVGPSSVVAHVDWGTYYPSALYADRDEVVVNVRGLQDEATFRQLKEIAQTTKRSLLFVKAAKSGVDWRRFQRSFDGLALVKAAGNSDSGWELWRWQTPGPL
jgi:hypothetical protein